MVSVWKVNAMHIIRYEKNTHTNKKIRVNYTNKQKNTPILRLIHTVSFLIGKSLVYSAKEKKNSFLINTNKQSMFVEILILI